MMPSRPSRTAMLVAGYRARATREWPELCDDPWAAALAGEEGIGLSHSFDGAQPHMTLWIGVRTAVLDRAVRRLGPALGQVVLLGAGLDTRAARLASPDMRFFEVDAPASQAEKHARLSALDRYPVDAARYASCDFEHDDFLEVLAGVGFDAAAPALFLWEGVTCYLDETAVRATLGRIARGTHPKSTVLFDFLGKKLAERRTRDPADHETLGFVDDLGEPVRWGTNDVLPLLYEEGFRKVHVTSFDEACLNLTGTYARERKFRFEWIAQASREGPLATDAAHAEHGRP